MHVTSMVGTALDGRQGERGPGMRKAVWKRSAAVGDQGVSRDNEFTGSRDLASRFSQRVFSEATRLTNGTMRQIPCIGSKRNITYFPTLSIGGKRQK